MTQAGFASDRRPRAKVSSTMRWPVATLLAAQGCGDLVGRSSSDASLDLAPITDAPDAAVGADVRVTADTADGSLDVIALDAHPCPRRGALTVARSARFGTMVGGDPLTMATPRGGFVDAMGRVMVVGQCVRCGPENYEASRLAVWRFRWDTLALDTTFGFRGAALDAAPASRAFSEALGGFVDDAGRLVVFGHESPVGNNNQALVVRFTPEGALDPSFGTRGRFVLTQARLGAAQGVVVFSAAHDRRGTVFLVNDGGHWAAQSQRAWAFRLDDAGELDRAFGTAGIVDLSSVVGCFDVALDGDRYVLACMSPSVRPKLVQLDGDGEVLPWPGGARAEADQAPRRFEVRSLDRDAEGRWVVTGAATTAYSDASSSAVAVRFSAEGAPDLTFGLGGVAAIFGPRSSFAFGFQHLAAVSCEDRLLVGGNVGPTPVVSVLDGRGGVLDEVGTFGSVALATELSSSTVHAVLVREGTSDAVAVVSRGVGSMSLHRLEQ